MQRKFTLLAVFFLIAPYTYSQLPSWDTKITVPNFEFQPFGDLLENDNTIISINGGIYSEVNHFGFAQKTFNLPGPSSNPYYKQYFFFEKADALGNDFYLAANRLSITGNEMYLHTVFDDGMTGITEFLLDDNLQNHLKKGPAALKTQDGDFVIFGNQNFYKVNVPDPQTIDIIWSKPGGFGLISAADLYNDGFILCNEDGYLIHIDENGDEVWNQNVGFRLMSVQTLSDGFMLCGQVDDESALIKTDLSGNISWQKTYGNAIAYDLTITSDDGIAFTGISNDEQVFVVKTDADGNEIWHKYYGNGQGREILESQYGGFLIRGKSDEALLIRIDEKGNSGDAIPFEINGPKRLHTNKISTSANAGGKHFGSSDGKIDYHFPKGSETLTLSTGGLWMAGLNNNNELHFAGSEFAQNHTGFPFQGGYIGSDPAPWAKAWSVDRSMIKLVRDDLADGTQDLPWPEDIITWPGKGNPNYFFDGQQVDVPVEMAPFVDVNNDGTYNVYDGDHPKIKGDQMLWWVMNDDTERPSNEGLALGVQVICSFYSIGCVDDELIDQATFIELDIQNLSQKDYADFYLGWLSALQIGCYDDDYVGSIPVSNAVFVYNADETDDSHEQCSYDLASFGDLPPIQTVTFLNQDADIFMTYSNGGIDPTPPPGTEDPSNAQEHYNLLRGIYRDGIPLTEGGNGHNIGSMEFTEAAFPGNPALNSGWSGCADELDLHNRRMVMSKGPMTFQAGETLSLKVALLTLTDVPQPCPDSDLIAGRIADLKNIYNNSDFTYGLDLGPDQMIDEGETIILDAGIGGENYLWSTGETSSSIEISMPGTYSVTVSTTWGCELVDEITVSFTVSTKNIELSTFNVYPNPTNDQLFIELNDQIPENILLENTVGQRLESIQIPTGSENTTLALNIQNPVPGVYFLRFDFEGKQTIQKIVLVK